MHTFHVMPLQVFTNNLKRINRYISWLWLFLLQELFSCCAADITDKAKVFIATVCVFSCMSHMIKYPECWTVGINYCSKQKYKGIYKKQQTTNLDVFFSINIITNKLHTKLYAKKSRHKQPNARLCLFWHPSNSRGGKFENKDENDL